MPDKNIQKKEKNLKSDVFSSVIAGTSKAGTCLLGSKEGSEISQMMLEKSRLKSKSTSEIGGNTEEPFISKAKALRSKSVKVTKSVNNKITERLKNNAY